MQNNIKRRYSRRGLILANKLVVKTAVKTVVGIVIILIIGSAVVNVAFPSAMASLCEGTGNYTFAVKYAQLEYSYTGNTSDLSRVVEDAVYANRYDLIVEYGDKLIAREDFSTLATQKDSYYQTQYESYSYSYLQYIYGRIAVAYYSANSDYQTAVARAEEGRSRDERGTFATGNAYVPLAVAVAERGDVQNAQTLSATLSSLNVQEGEQEYLNGLISVLNSVKA
jgi:hypothetical protein